MESAQTVEKGDDLVRGKGQSTTSPGGSPGGGIID